MTPSGPVRRIWVTRAEPGASRTAARLTVLGMEPVVAPLLEIRQIPQPPPDLEGITGLVFTSANGVAAFDALVGPQGSVHALPVFAVGDATARAAREAGFSDVRSAAGDVDALATLIRRAGAGAVLLHPCARVTAGDLGAALGAAAELRALPVYSAEETGRAPPPGFDVVLIHSPLAAHALARVLARGEAQALTGRLAVAISPAAAAPLAEAPFSAVRIARTPDETALLDSLIVSD